MPRRKPDAPSKNLPDITEVEILKYLCLPYHQKFDVFADTKPRHVFGTCYGTREERELRNKVRNRKNYLRKHPEVVRKQLENFGLQVPRHLEESLEESQLISPQSIRPPDRGAEGEYSTPRKLDSEENPQAATLFLSPTSNQVNTLNTHSSTERALPSRTMDRDDESGSILYEADLTGDQNPEGILFAHSPNAKVNESLVAGRIIFYVPVYDIRDYKAGRIKASLNNEGDKIIVKVPTYPMYMWKPVRKPGKADLHLLVQDQDIASGDICANTAAAVCAVATKIESSSERLTKTMAFTIPPIYGQDVLVNNEHFNVGAEGGKVLTGRFRLAGSAVSSTHQTHGYVWFSVAITGSEQKLRNVKQNSEEDELAKALASTLIYDSE